MAIAFNARFDITNYSTIDSFNWTIEGDVVDNTGNFTAYNVAVGDIIYCDASMLGLGVLRYKITSVNSAIGASVNVNAVWDIADETAIEPIPASAGCIGKPNSKGSIYLPDAGIQVLDISFLTNVRNVETDLLSKQIGSGGSVPSDIMTKSTYDINSDGIVDTVASMDAGGF